MVVSVLWTAMLIIFLFYAPTYSPIEPLSVPEPTPTIKACLACEDLQILPDTAVPMTGRPDTPTRTPAPDIAVVQAVLFWMDGCPHCEEVMAAVLPPLQRQYGEQLDIHLIEVVSTEDMDRLYQLAAAYEVPKEQVGVPFVVIGDRALVGSRQIPAEFPRLIESYLSRGGANLPELPGWSDELVTPSAQGTCAPATPCADETSQAQAMAFPALEQGSVEPAAAAMPHSAARSNGFTLAMAVMAAMLLALGYVSGATVWAWQGAAVIPLPSWLQPAIPLLALAGLGVAGYLAYVETLAVPAVCGPVGECNLVQSSPYARLFGVLPVGVAGMAGYVAILAAWAWARLGAGHLKSYAALTVFGMAVFGVIFSLYLTYLEPFVIGAVCIWCLSSAVIMTLLMVFSLRPALRASQEAE